MKCLAIVDIGNSRVKAAVIRFDHQIVKTTAAPLDELDKAFAQVLNNNLSSVLIAVSGDEVLAEKILSFCREKRIAARVISNKGSLPFKSMYAAGEAGIDRLANVAALAADIGAPAIAIDIGTAVTMEVLDPDKQFIGGAILPGMRMQATALASGTAALPDIGSTEASKCAIGNSTVEAIDAGIRFGVAGAIEKLVENARQLQNMDSAPVVVTGGDAVDLLPLLNIPLVRHDKDLTLRGLYWLGLCQHPDLFR